MGDQAKGKGSEHDPLSQCEQTVEQLKEENQQLRESAVAFGELAERLNAQKALPREETPPADGGRK